MKYYYFISFECENECGWAKGNMTFDSPAKIRTSEDVKTIQTSIEKNNKVRKVTISNIVLLDSE